ncbi:MAG TPA: orotidine-5'-phosphate decarboxylase [Acidiferrobacterales bacterium]|nr:orotidine-5'-phosphate decarboxylase [Acidiferrobacterales bacterium]
MAKTDTGRRIIVALDYPSAGQALAFLKRVSPKQCRVKVGLELYTAAGPHIIEQLTKPGFDVFLDLKFHDIPNTVARACQRAAERGVWMLNVHALGGGAMLAAAREAIAGFAARPLLLGVTILTSHGQSDIEQLGLPGTVEQNVINLAQLAYRAGLDGVVCSAQEANSLRQKFGQNYVLVTPGIRLAGSAPDDQNRVLSPREAVKQGADYLVIGRPVTQAADPGAVLEEINKQISIS